jgi:glycosyltransferase involved in cell wall biosynthesis
MTKNILYISYDGMTDPLGQSQVLPYLCGLSKHGYQFTLISCEKPDKFQKNKSVIEEICQKNNIDWQPLIYHKSPPILSTIWDIYQIQKATYKLHEKTPFDLVHCRGYISALIGLGLKNKYNVRFLFDMRGLWADEKVDAGAWNQDKWIYRLIYRFFKRKEKEFFLSADASVSLTNAGKSEIQSWNYMKGIQDNIHVIPCCADTNLFNPNTIIEEKIIKWRQKLGILPTDDIVSYLGSIGTWYMLEEMLDFFVEFLKTRSNAKFLFITHDEHDRIREAAQKRGLENHIIIQPGQRSEVPTLLSLSEFSLFFIRPTYSKISSSPTKQGEIMAMGIPIICNAGVGDTDYIINKYHSGVLNYSFNLIEYKKTIERVSSAHFDSDKIIIGAKKYFDLKNGVNQYFKIYQRLIDPIIDIKQ